MHDATWKMFALKDIILKEESNTASNDSERRVHADITGSAADGSIAPWSLWNSITPGGNYAFPAVAIHPGGTSRIKSPGLCYHFATIEGTTASRGDGIVTGVVIRAADGSIAPWTLRNRQTPEGNYAFPTWRYPPVGTRSIQSPDICCQLATIGETSGGYHINRCSQQSEEERDSEHHFMPETTCSMICSNSALQSRLILWKQCN